jgi:hypothetical protein
MNIRNAATLVFGVILFILTAMATGFISANVRKLADKHGWDNFLIRWTEKLRWERLRRPWWLWSLLFHYELGRPWSLALPELPDAVFHYLSRGSAILVLQDGRTLRMVAGDFVLATLSGRPASPPISRPAFAAKSHPSP